MPAKLSPEIRKLVQEVFAPLGKKHAKLTKEDPELYLVALLKEIKQDLQETAVTLGTTIEGAAAEVSMAKLQEQYGADVF